jgi:hypothetical protein
MDIGSKRVPFWIHRRKDPMHVVRVIGPLQPVQGRIMLTEPDVHQRRRVGGTYRSRDTASNVLSTSWASFVFASAYVAPKAIALLFPPLEAPAVWGAEAGS